MRLKSKWSWICFLSIVMLGEAGCRSAKDGTGGKVSGIGFLDEPGEPAEETRETTGTIKAIGNQTYIIDGQDGTFELRYTGQHWPALLKLIPAKKTVSVLGRQDTVGGFGEAEKTVITLSTLNLLSTKLPGTISVKGKLVNGLGGPGAASSIGIETTDKGLLALDLSSVYIGPPSAVDALWKSKAKPITLQGVILHLNSLEGPQDLFVATKIGS